MLTTKYQKGNVKKKKRQYLKKITIPNIKYLEINLSKEVRMNPPRLKGVQYSTGKEQRAIANGSGKNEVAGPNWK